jgi:hypothetical protein
MFILKITVNSFWGSNYSALSVMLGKVLSQKAGVGVGVVSSDDN